jgi:hypothetical protein
MVRVIANVLGQPPYEEVVQGPEQAGDVPPPKNAFDQAEKETRPAQQREARQKNAQRAMLNRRCRPYQIAQNAIVSSMIISVIQEEKLAPSSVRTDAPLDCCQRPRRCAGPRSG